MNDKPLFAGKNCSAFSQFYDDAEQFDNMADGRIPSLLTLRNGKYKGTVIAAADKASCGADWGRIEIAVRRSTDNGESFSKMKTIFSCPVRKYPYNRDDYTCAFAIDPLMFETDEGKVVMLFDFYPECKGLHASRLLEKGSGYVKENGEDCLILTSGKSALDGIFRRKGKRFALHKDGFVYDENNARTKYYVPLKHSEEYAYVTKGDMYYCRGEKPQYESICPPLIPENNEKDDIYVGNIFLSKGKPSFEPDKPVFVQKKSVKDEKGNELCIETSAAPLRALLTSYIYMTESSDGGETFTEPVDITPFYKEDSDGTFLGVGPGIGITVQNEKCKGRLLAPAYIPDKALVLISDDAGKTWRRGKSKFCENIDECQLAETKDGKILCFGRPKGGGKIPFSVSDDFGETFRKLPPLEMKIPQCQHSVISLPESIALPDNLVNDGSYILFASPTGHGGKDASRTDGKVFLGRIQGENTEFIKSYDITDSEKYKSFGEYADFYAYSCLTVLADGKIGLFYEAYPSGYITFAKFSL